MEDKNPCRACVHYEYCGGSEICNSFVHKFDERCDQRDIDQSENEYIEYRAAYDAYLRLREDD